MPSSRDPSIFWIYADLEPGCGITRIFPVSPCGGFRKSSMTVPGVREKLGLLFPNRLMCSVE
jgi:hypothetical protein